MQQHTIVSTDIEQFVIGAAAFEAGPAGGVTVHRLPAWARSQVDDTLFTWAESCPAGARLRFATSADTVELRAAATTVAAPGDATPPVTLVVRDGTGRHEVTLSTPTVIEVDDETHIQHIRAGDVETVPLPSLGSDPIDVHLPHNARIELLSLRADKPLSPVAPRGLRWTHYGSSISQGMNADAPDRTWPAAAASALGWNLRDFSFAGNAQLDGFAARVIRDRPADLITLKIGINTINADSMRERTFLPAVHAFLDTIRESQPSTRIVLISPISCPIHEDSPGPVVMGDDGLAQAARREIEQDAGALTLARIRQILSDVVAQRVDDALSYLDGRELFGPDDVAHLYDRLHPDQTGLALIGHRFSTRFGAMNSADRTLTARHADS